MAIVGIIPARGGSKGLPGKNIMDILGRPVISYVIDAGRASKALDRVIVSTDDSAIADVSRQFGADVVMRPAEIAGDTAPVEEALRHVVRTVEAEGVSVEIAVFMQANVPVRDPAMIDRVVEALLKSDCDTMESATLVNQRPEWMKKVVDGHAVPFMESRSYRRQELPELIIFDGAVEAIRRDVLMGTAGKTGVHTYMGDRVGFVLHDRIYSLDLDGPDDVPLITGALMYLKEKDKK